MENRFRHRSGQRTKDSRCGDTGTSAEPMDLRACLEAFEARRLPRARPRAWFDGEIALCETLVERIEALRRAAGIT